MLKNAALDFVCIGEVTEMVDTSRDGHAKDLTLHLDNRDFSGVPDRIRFVCDRGVLSGDLAYDFPFIREGSRVKEKRILLEEGLLSGKAWIRKNEGNGLFDRKPP